MRAYLGTLRKDLWRQRYLLALLLPALVIMIVFRYLPILGLQIAFKDFSFRLGTWGSPWAGLKQFQYLFQDITVVPAIVNTLGISILKLVLGFPLPIVLALMLNEVRNNQFRRTVQTISYMPHFIAYSVVALMLSIALANWGIVNKVLTGLGILQEPYLFLGRAEAFWWVVVFTDIWKETGWSSIIFLAALTSIPVELYEAATIDGANRFQKMVRISLPGIKPTVVLLLILQVGRIVNGANFDLSYLLRNALNAARSEILPTYILRVGISMGRFSYATAVTLIFAMVSLILVVTANFASRKLTKEGLF